MLVDTKPDKGTQRWLQFSLYDVLLALTVGAVAFACLRLVMWEADRQRRAVLRLSYSTNTILLSDEASWIIEDLDIIYSGRVQSIGIDDEQFSDLLAVKEFRNLEELCIPSSRIYDLSPLRQMRRLGTLCINESCVEDVLPLADLDNLHTLSLNGSAVVDVSPLAEMRGLERLFLSGTNVSDLRPLSGLNNLCELHVDETKVDDVSSLRSLYNLRDLRLAGSRIRNIRPLSSLKRLERLDIMNTDVSAEDVEWLRRRLPQCNVVSDAVPNIDRPVLEDAPGRPTELD